LAVNGDFALLDKNEDELAELLEAGMITQEKIDRIKNPAFAMFTPVRGDIQLAKGFGGNSAAFYPPEVCPADAPLDKPQNFKKLFNKDGFRKISGYDYFGSTRNSAAELIQYQKMRKYSYSCH
jgi:hypothetical protein